MVISVLTEWPVLEPSLQDPSMPTRPHSISELARFAKDDSSPSTRSVKGWLRVADTLRKQGQQSIQDGDIQAGFLYLARSAIHILEKIPHHPSYHDLNPKQMSNLRNNGHEILHNLEQIKPRLTDLYEEWRAKDPRNATAPSELQEAYGASIDPIVVARPATGSEMVPGLVPTQTHMQTAITPPPLMAQASTSRRIKVNVLAAHGLIKRDVFRLPHPFAVVTIDGDSNTSQTTEVVKSSLSPPWSQYFDFTVKDHSVIKVQIFDATRFNKKKDSGFLGVVNIRVSELDLSNHHPHNFELKSNNHQLVNGRLGLQIILSNSASSTRDPLTGLFGAFDISQQPNNSLSSSSQNAAIIPLARPPFQNAMPFDPHVSSSISFSSPVGRPTSGYAALAQSPTPTQPQPVITQSTAPNLQVVASAPVQGPNIVYNNHSNELGPLPPNWQRRKDNIGRDYYVNHFNQETTWHRPSFNQTTNANEQGLDQSMARDRYNQRILVDDMLVSNSGNLPGAEVTRRPSAAPTPVVTTPAPIGDGLGQFPAGWQAGRAPDGRIYYVNHNSRETTWDDPRHVRSGATTARSNVGAAGQLPLPAGWEEHRTSEGRAYYFELSSRSTTWVDPRRGMPGAAAARSNSGAAGQHLDPIPLPAGRKERQTPEGRVYVDHNSSSPSTSNVAPTSSGTPSSSDISFSIPGGRPASGNIALEQIPAISGDTDLDILESEPYLAERFGIHVPNLSGQVRRLDKGTIFSGTYSTVYPGMYGDMKVAIKVLRMATENDNIQRKFRRELLIWSRLRHANILPLYGYFEDKEGGHFPSLISKWAEHGSAAQYITGNLRWDQRASLFYDVAKGLNYLHGFEPIIIHADLKPQNVVVNNDGVGQLCDFGVTRFVQEELESGLTTTTAHTGTTRYLAYELVEYDDEAIPTTATDMYALGCLGLEFIYRILPHASLGMKLGRITRAIGDGIPPAKRPANPEDVVPILWDLVEACWIDDPEERPTATQVSDYLEKNLEALSESLEQCPWTPEYPTR